MCTRNKFFCKEWSLTRQFSTRSSETGEWSTTVNLPPLEREECKGHMGTEDWDESKGKMKSLNRFIMLWIKWWDWFEPITLIRCPLPALTGRFRHPHFYHVHINTQWRLHNGRGRYFANSLTPWYVQIYSMYISQELRASFITRGKNSTLALAHFTHVRNYCCWQWW